MKVTLNENTCHVEAEPGDPRFTKQGSKMSRSGFGNRESRFLHHVKLALKAQGHDVIKKRMWKDGHMVSDHQQYIRERRWKFAVYWGSYAIRDAVDDFIQEGEVTLQVVRDLIVKERETTSISVGVADA